MSALIILFVLSTTAISINNALNFIRKEKKFFSCKCTEEIDTMKSQQFIPTKLSKIIDFIAQKSGYVNCDYRENAMKILEIQLHKKVIGQKDATHTILNHLKSHLQMKIPLYKKSPLVLHFAGDFGVGKTLTASIISSYLFKNHEGKDPVDHGGTLLFSGSNFLPHQFKENAESEKLSADKLKSLRNDMFKQIKRCPNSLIIINDLQKMDSAIFSKLEDFFEGVAYSADHRPVITRNVTFIFTSDFGAADISRTWKFSRLESEIKNRFSLYTNFNRKLGSLVVHVPFYALSKESIKTIFHNELSEALTCNPLYDCVQIDHSVIDYLVSQWEKSDIIRKMNGRSFHKYIYPTFVESELRGLSFLEVKSGNNRLLSLYIGGGDGNNDNKTILASKTYIRKNKIKGEL